MEIDLVDWQLDIEQCCWNHYRDQLTEQLAMQASDIFSYYVWDARKLSAL